MQPLEDDMDAIFRQAAEDYPLNTSGASWEQLQQKMQQAPEATKSKKRFFWLFLLLPIALVWYLRPSPNDRSEQHAAILEVLETGNGYRKGFGSEKLSDQAYTDGPNGQMVAAEVESIKTSAYKKQPTTPDGLMNANMPLNKKDGRLNKSSAAKFSAASGLADKQDRKTEFSPAMDGSVNTNAAMDRTRFIQERNLPLLAYHPLTLKDHSLLLFDPTKPQEQHRSVKKFYAGLTGGIDYTTIKFQQLEAPGFSAGLLLGYQFNRRWGIESGFLYNKKFYYTKGIYFQFKDYYLPPSTQLQAVNGVCYMWEIPLRLRYTFGNNEKHAWFASAGSSSYILNKEQYNYAVTYGYNPQQHTYSRQNEPGSFLPFAMLELSGGYNRRLAKGINIRIEPILQLPLRSIGSGSLPMQSSAIRLTVTKALF
jgi:hypothetical protein